MSYEIRIIDPKGRRQIFEGLEINNVSLLAPTYEDAYRTCMELLDKFDLDPAYEAYKGCMLRIFERRP